MRLRLGFILLFVIFICNCAASKKNVREGETTQATSFTVRVINDSFEKVSLRYQQDDLSYTFRFVDSKNEVKFLMNGNLTLQYSLTDYDNAKIIKIKQDTLIHIKQNDIIIDNLPPGEKIKPVNKTNLEKVK